MRITRFSALVGATSVLLGLGVASPAATSGPVRAGDDSPQSTLHGLIAFQATDAEGSPQLFTVRPDGTDLTQITHLVDAVPGNPDWSPDGRKIAFDVDNGEGALIYLANPDGSDPTILPGLVPETGGAAYQPAYSTSGRELFFERYDVETDATGIFRVPVAGGAPLQVTHPPQGYFDTDPNPSPDGRTLSFVRIGGVDEEQSGLFTIDLASGLETQLTPFTFNVAVKHGWAPNGQRIMFTRDFLRTHPGISGNVITIAPDGSDLRNVTTYSGGDVHGVGGSYSPDGRWIVFREQHPDRSPLMIAHPDGSDAHPILEIPGLRPRTMAWGNHSH